MTPQASVLLGVILGASIGLLGSVLVTERQVRADRKRSKDERFIQGTEKLLESLERFSGTVMNCSHELTRFAYESEYKIDTKNIDINFPEVGAFQMLYAPYTETEMDLLSAAFKAFDQKYRAALVAANSKGPRAFDELDEFQTSLKEVAIGIAGMQEAVIHHFHERKLIFESIPSKQSAATQE